MRVWVARGPLTVTLEGMNSTEVIENAAFLAT